MELVAALLTAHKVTHHLTYLTYLTYLILPLQTSVYLSKVWYYAHLAHLGRKVKCDGTCRTENGIRTAKPTAGRLHRYPDRLDAPAQKQKVPCQLGSSRDCQR